MAEPTKSLRRERKRTREVARGTGKIWLGLARALFYPVTTLLSRNRVWGMEHVPAEGPALLVINHVSHLDPVYDAVTTHRAGRVPRFLAKSTLWNIPVLKSLLTGVDQIPVYRGTTDAERSLQDAHEALRNGKVLIIYPDGTITKDPDGWPMTPKNGVARLALAHDVPVIPAARWGTREIYDHYKKRFRPFPRKQVNYSFGEPLDLAEYRAKSNEAHTLREVTYVIMGRVRELLGEVRGAHPPSEYYAPKRAHRAEANSTAQQNQPADPASAGTTVDGPNTGPDDAGSTDAAVEREKRGDDGVA